MKVGVVRETLPGEHRVALTPGSLAALTKTGLTVLIESGAGDAAGLTDRDYVSAGAGVADSRAEVLAACEVLCQVRTFGANPSHGQHDLGMLSSEKTLIGLADPFANPRGIEQLAHSGIRCFALEMLPRISRAQSMDVLSSQATVAGYKAVLMAAMHSPRLFPMMMTAAGTVAAVKALVIGAGVAGLQAVATARRLGAIVQAYDVRAAVKEQVQSLGAKFLELDLDVAAADGKGGYAAAMDETFYRRQREMMSRAVAASDLVITTAAVPGQAPPVLIAADTVRAMAPGSVIVDLAARPDAAGGNCELTVPDEVVHEYGVTILGPTNLPATVPYTASQLFARNVANFLRHITKDGQLALDMNDEIIAQTLVTANGQVVHPRLKESSELKASS